MAGPSVGPAPASPKRITGGGPSPDKACLCVDKPTTNMFHSAGCYPGREDGPFEMVRWPAYLANCVDVLSAPCEAFEMPSWLAAGCLARAAQLAPAAPISASAKIAAGAFSFDILPGAGLSLVTPAVVLDFRCGDDVGGMDVTFEVDYVDEAYTAQLKAGPFRIARDMYGKGTIVIFFYRAAALGSPFVTPINALLRSALYNNGASIKANAMLTTVPINAFGTGVPPAPVDLMGPKLDVAVDWEPSGLSISGTGNDGVTVTGTILALQDVMFRRVFNEVARPWGG